MIDQRVSEGIYQIFQTKSLTTTIPAQLVKNLISVVPVYIER